jgi:hypothetical protein
MNINKHNYEAFFLDYHEGNLSPQQVAELLLFVEQHPGLKEEFENFENITLEDISSFSFEDKASLKKEIVVSNKDEFFIRSVENDLSAVEEKLLVSFLQHNPQYLPELELYKKTKLKADTIVFPGKENLKEIPAAADNLLIASVEGILSPAELSLLEKQASADAELKKDLKLFRHTRLKPELNIVYENKEELKRKEKRIIPFYYYVAAAAAVLLLFGLFSIFNGSTNTKPEMAAEHPKTEKQNSKIEIPVPVVQQPVQAPSLAANTGLNTAVPQNKKEKALPEKTSPLSPVNIPVLNKEEKPETNLAAQLPESKKENDPETAVKNEASVSNQPATNNAVAQLKKEEVSSGDYMTLAQVATTKIKEKTLDPEMLAAEKKTGRFKKVSGWDVLAVVAKGLSKVTGKKVEVKPTYNDEGDVTAYAFNAGKIGFSRGR